ncbi:MAG: hypothetical protein Q9191_006534 [Dirinaria sp. TL-2023a]
MEPLGNVATNVYKIDNIPEIYFFVYTTKSLSEQAFHEEHSNSKVSNAESEIISKARTVLEEASYELRRNEKLQGIIEPVNIPRSQHVSTTGPIDSPSGVLPGLEAYKEINSQAFEINEALKNLKELHNIESLATLTGKGSGIANRSAYLLFVAAVSVSVLWNMSLTGRWFPLGSGSCLRAPATSQNLAEHTPGYSGIIYFIKLAVDWQLPGTIIILAHSVPLSHIRQLSDPRIAIHEHLGKDVVMAPSGAIATLISDYAVPSNDHVKFYTERLSRSNIVIPPNVPWVRLRICEKVDLGVIAWPSHLCFLNVRKESTGEHSGCFANCIKNAKAIDPLVRVEQWYATRESRKDALAAYKQNQGASPENQERVDRSEDEDDLLEEVGYTSYQTFQQDMSGVYPTPPDGPTIQPHTLPAAQRQQIADEHGDIASIANSIRPSTPSFGNTPQGNVLAAQARASDGDLFGDMDTDFFAANDLTEADFNFFDEPSDDDQEITRNIQEASVPIDPSPEENLAGGASEPTVQIEDSRQPDMGELVLPQTDDFKGRIDDDIDNTAVEATNVSEEYLLETGLPKTHQLESTVPPKALGEVHRFNLTTLKDVSNFAAPNDRQKVFEPVPLQSSLHSFDSKYTDVGRFRSNHIDKPRGVDPGDTSSLIPREVPRLSGQHRSEDKVYESPDDDDFVDDRTSQISGANSAGDEDFFVQRLPEVHSEPTLKRKREIADELIQQVGTPSPFSTVSPIEEGYEIVGQSLTTALFAQHSNHDSESFLKTVANKYHKCSSTLKVPSCFEFLRIAQILVDQITLHNHNLFTSSKSLSGLLPASSPTSTELKEPLLQPLISALRGALRCDLKQLSTIGESTSPNSSQETQVTQHNNNINHIRWSVPWQGNAQDEDFDRIFPINAPLVAVRRANTPVDLSPSALVFWEELSLEPNSPQKDVDFICICPAKPVLEDRLAKFLDTVQSAYYACKLGTYTPYDGGGHPNGIYPIKVDSPTSFDELMNAIDDACKSIGKLLSESASCGGNFVIYIVDIFGEAPALPRLCQAFLKLFDTYASAMDEKQLLNPNDLVLQILPMSMFASADCFVSREPTAYRSFAQEVYNRCASNRDSMPRSPFLSAPAIQLARHIPRAINLQLTSKSPNGLPHADRCIHVAYCHSIQSGWLTASWTDNYGRLQWTAAYYLGDETSISDEQWPTFEDVASAMWDITMDIAEMTSTPYRVFVVKNGFLAQDELAASQPHQLLACHRKPRSRPTFRPNSPATPRPLPALQPQPTPQRRRRLRPRHSSKATRTPD